MYGDLVVLVIVMVLLMPVMMMLMMVILLFTMPGLNWNSAICSVVAASMEVWGQKLSNI